MDIITNFVYLPKAEITWLKFPCCYFLVITALKFTYRAAKTGEFPRIFSRQIEAIVYIFSRQMEAIFIYTMLKTAQQIVCVLHFGGDFTFILLFTRASWI